MSTCVGGVCYLRHKPSPNRPKTSATSVSRKDCQNVSICSLQNDRVRKKTLLKICCLGRLGHPMSALPFHGRYPKAPKDGSHPGRFALGPCPHMHGIRDRRPVHVQAQGNCPHRIKMAHEGPQLLPLTAPKPHGGIPGLPGEKRIFGRTLWEMCPRSQKPFIAVIHPSISK